MNCLMEKIAEIINEPGEEEFNFTSLDINFAYGQTTLHPETVKHCNLLIIGGNATGTYRVLTGYYELTITPTEFQ